MLLGASWLIIKTKGVLQASAVRWAQRAWWGALAGMLAICVVTPFLSNTMHARWFDSECLPWLVPLPLATAGLFVLVRMRLRLLQHGLQKECNLPFAASIGLFVVGFVGLGYGLFPWLVPGTLTFWQAAAAPEALRAVFAVSCVVLPLLLGYSFWVFRGKAQTLGYAS